MAIFYSYVKLPVKLVGYFSSTRISGAMWESVKLPEGI